MKQTKYQKVVKGDKDYLKNSWFFGITSILLPLTLIILKNNLSFLDIVFNAFLDGMLFWAFVHSISDYIESRKVYWRKIK